MKFRLTIIPLALFIFSVVLCGCTSKDDIYSQAYNDGYNDAYAEIEQNESDVEIEEYSSPEETQEIYPIDRISQETGLPVWQDAYWEYSYTIQRQENMSGETYLWEFWFPDIVKKDNKIYLKCDDGDAIFFIEITDDQLSEIYSAGNVETMIISFEVSEIYDVDVTSEYDIDEYSNSIDFYTDATYGYIIAYGVCKEIYEIDTY